MEIFGNGKRAFGNGKRAFGNGKRAFGNGKREIFYIINNLTFIQNLEIQVLKLMNKFYVYYLVFY